MITKLTAHDAKENRIGVTAALTAYTLWGLIPLYFIATKAVPAWELLAHRVLWSILFGAVILQFRGQWQDVFDGLKRPIIIKILTISAFLIALNWGVFIIAVQEGDVFQSSLGYYITPLINVLVGVIFLRETLRKLQWFAVLLAAIGVFVLSAVGGVFPAYALVMAVSFAAYSYIRKHMESIASFPALFIETLIMLPIAIAYLVYLGITGQAVVPQSSPELMTIVILIGPVSLAPLLAFTVAARRLRLSTLGFLQFIGPTMHFVIGYVMGEDFTLGHQICFALIWLAAILLMVDFKRQGRERAAASSGG